MTIDELMDRLGEYRRRYGNLHVDVVDDDDMMGLVRDDMDDDNMFVGRTEDDGLRLVFADRSAASCWSTTQSLHKEPVTLPN